MKTVILALFSVFSIQSAWADTLSVKGQIIEAVVYRDQAMLTCQAQVNIPAGRHEVVIKQLPLQLNPTSLQVSGRGDFTILGASRQVNYLQPADLPVGAKRLRDSLEDAEEDLALYTLQLQTYEQEKEMLLQNRKVGGENTGLQAEQLQKAADFFRQRMLEVNAKIVSLQDKTKKQKEQTDNIRRQLEQQLARYKDPFSQVVVPVRAAKSGQATVTVTFLTPGATWYPEYEARARESQPKIELVLRGMVQQNTGMDWRNVKLTLSTGQPGLGAQKPELNGLVVDFERPRVMYNMAPGRAMKKRSADAPELEKAEELADQSTAAAPAANYQEVAVYDGSLSMLYTVADPATLLNGSEAQSMELRRQELNAIQKLETAPAADPDVFVTATFRDWADLGLVPGGVKVFFDGQYTGDAWLPASSAADSVVLSLGRDRKVLASRKEVPGVESKNFIGSQRRKTYQFEITLRNNRKEAATVRLEDRIPLSRNAEIEVEREELSGGSVDETTGKVTWLVSVPAGQSKVIKLRYAIKHPKGKAIQVYGS